MPVVVSRDANRRLSTSDNRISGRYIGRTYWSVLLSLTRTRLIARLVDSRCAVVARTSSRVVVDRRRIARSRDIRKRYPGRQDDRRQDTWTAHPSRSRPLPLSSFRHLPHPLFLSSPLSLFLSYSLLFHHYLSAPL